MREWSPLSQAVKARCPEGEQALLSNVYGGGKKYIASFADLIFEALEAEDPLAEEILARNMKVAAQVIEAAGRRFPEKECQIPVVLAGGLTNQPIVLTYLQKSLQDPERFRLQILQAEPVYGAVSMARKMWAQRAAK